MIFDEFKGGKGSDCYASYARLVKGMLKKVSFVVCGRLLFIAISSADFPLIDIDTTSKKADRVRTSKVSYVSMG